MDRKALFVGIEARAGAEAEVAQFLTQARISVEGEPGTHDWYALRFGPADFAIFDTFVGNAGRLKHLLGEVGRGLIVRTVTQLDGLPEIRPADIVAEKTPPAGIHPTLALYAALKPRSGQEDAVRALLVAGAGLAGAESGTLGWYGVELLGGAFAILDVFADAAGRDAHLAGQIAASLNARAAELFAEPPVIRRAEVMASKTAQAIAEA